MPQPWTLRTLAEPGTFAADWDRVSMAGSGTPFMQWRYLAAALDHLGAGSVRLACASDGHGPCAAAVVESAGPGRWALYQPSQLPLGAWVARPGCNLATLADGLLHALPGLALGLGLTQLDPLHTPRPADGPRMKTLDYIQTAWVDVAGPWDAFWEARGKNLRSNMRKQRSKLEADGVVLQFDVITGALDMPAAVAAFGRLEAAGWKAGMGTAVDPATAQGLFYIDMLQRFCATGNAQVWQLKFGDKVVAVDLCIEQGGTLVILKTAYDPEYRTVSPAFLLKQEAFKRVFDEGRIRRIEFYGRRMEWHTRWSEQVRTLYHANVYRWALVPRVHGQVKRWFGRAAPDDAAAAAHLPEQAAG